MASTTEKKCNFCERYFPEQIFNLHQRVHSEDKFHPCKNDCGKVFTSKTDLLKHCCDDALCYATFASSSCTKKLIN